MMNPKVDNRVNWLGLIYMILALFENPYARFICFALFVAVIIILKDELDRLVTEKFLIKQKLEEFKQS